MNTIDNDWLYNSQPFQSFFKNSLRSLVLKANAPHFTILAASDHYLQIAHKERHQILNKNLFEVYPGSGAVSSQQLSLYHSLLKVIDTKTTDVLPAVKYEEFVAETGQSVAQYWSGVNEPITDNNGNVAYIINTTINVTDRMPDKQPLEEATEDKEVLNEMLLASNKELYQTRQELQSLNEELAARVENCTKVLKESEAKLRNLIEQAPVAVAIFYGPQFIIELFNKKVLEYWGRTAEQVKGVPLFTALPEAKNQGFEELLTNVYTTGERFVANELPVTLMRNDILETTWINFIYEPLRNKNGDITGIIVVCNEVTEQVNARKHLESIVAEKTALEITLRNSQHRLQSILDTMAEGVSITDARGQLVYANAMAQRILGLDESEIKERTHYDPKWHNLRLDGSPLPPEEHPVSIMLSTGKAVYDHEIGVQLPGKEVVYISINAAPLFDEEGNLTGGIGTFMDVTNRRKLLQQKDDFISVASHELKTPLTSLKASLQLLNSLKGTTTFSPVMQTLIEQTDRSVDKLHVLVNDLLDVNRISRGQLLLKKVNFPIGDMINDCCHHVRIAGSHDITLEGDIDQVVYADEQRINQVIVNFVNNAVKYAPDSRHIMIVVKAWKDKVKVAVTDFGPGIPKAEQLHLFDRYYRANYAIGQGGGLGLGLYISAQIIKSHSGEIGVDSEEGKGSTFWFTLPSVVVSSSSGTAPAA